MHPAAPPDPNAAIGRTVAWLQPSAPIKPALGAPCNGCGLCCLAEPCPIGIVVSRRRRGACRALRWDGLGNRYRCGMVSEPAAVLGLDPRWPLGWLAALARRWIAAGSGCDAQLEYTPVRRAPD